MLNIVIPMAGSGRRFQERGYTFPKPLIEIKKRPMIEIVTKNIAPEIEHKFTFICRKEHYDNYALHYLLNLLSPGCNIIVIDRVTEGAACTILLAKEYINNEDPLIIANADQYIDSDINEFVSCAVDTQADGLIMSFKAKHPKWSFAKLDSQGQVIEVAEKKPISDNATVGIYYFKQGKYFVDAAEAMIKKDMRVNNEFYVCPVYNELILKDKIIKTFEVPAEAMYGLGTPEDLDKFLESPIIERL